MIALFRPLAAALLVANALPLRAQTAQLVQQSLAFPGDSGALANPTAVEQVLASHTVRVANASWIRLRFQLVQLWNDGDESSGAFLRITSHRDGAVQELHARSAREWRATSAYFNGDAVQIDLVAPPGAGASRWMLRSVWIGPQSSPQFSQCGPTDDRVPASDPRTARLLPVGCTGWLFDDCNHCFGTAGHCVGSGSLPNNNLDVAEFNVPPSNGSGLIQHPSPDDQYAIDDGSIQFQNGGVGNDWGAFGCFPNSNTSLTPFQAQGACYRLVAPPPFASGIDLRVTGFGTDSTPDWTYNQRQQTHSGPYFSYVGTTVRYQVDTTGGNSGSPLIWETGASDQVVGVHTHGGCNAAAPINANHGTSSTHAGWTLARSAPLGVCMPVPSATTFCTAKVNSLGCTPQIGAVGSPSASGAPGSFTIVGSALLNQKSGLLFYGFLPASTPFAGGFKCVGTPTVRTPVQATGGSPSGADCSGTIALDMAARIASGVDTRLTCGAIVYAQIWSRDPADAFTTSLTAGLRFTIGL
jgi:hypothetical protein